jgi:hypothetical protein
MPRARPCPRLIWIVSTLMTRIPRLPRSQALPSSLLRVVSAEGHLLISTKMCDTFSTALALHSTFAKRPSSQTDQSHSHSHLPRAVNPRGCSPLRALSLAARVSRSRKTLARRGHAAAQRLRRHIARKALACGLASYEHDTLSTNTEKPKEGLTKKGRKGIINVSIDLPLNSYIHTPHIHTVFLHARVYFPSPPPKHPTVYVFLVMRRHKRVYNRC